MAATLQGPFGLIVLNMSTLTVGHASDNQLVINDASISLYHALILTKTQHTSIIDLGSVNGTYVNNQRLEQNSPRPLRTGDSIRIGNTTCRYEESPSWPPPFPATLNRGNNPGLQLDDQVQPPEYIA